MNPKPKSKKLNKAWLHDHLNDPYVKLANREALPDPGRLQAEGNRRDARADQTRASGRRPGSTHGAGASTCGVGSPSGAASGELAGTIIALNILPMEPIERDLPPGRFPRSRRPGAADLAMNGRLADVVVSDIAPNIRHCIRGRSAHLIELAISSRTTT
jgi:23S rRNA (uridine2552-2'-O)-methyltransferase